MTPLGPEFALSVPKNAGQKGRLYLQSPPALLAGLVEAARFLGGHLFDSFRTRESGKLVLDTDSGNVY